MLFMNRNKKGLHKVTANVLSLTLASVMVAADGIRYDSSDCQDPGS